MREEMHNERPPDDIGDILKDKVEKEGAFAKSLLPKPRRDKPNVLSKEVQAPKNAHELLDKAIKDDGKIANTLLARRKSKDVTIDKDCPHPENYLG